ncbi:uncharacterized protein PFL1_05609 [Pseudozyma flocculosa PF-1]|uniref:RING-type domain-containing protein n=1 Tax=Pseudozyma flocculosa PF-1 TaxID=1277687 RepID=A0A061H3Q6_9BASI|nr:uncharacterized protein PFL1_05609 [Pseudozyma flocculosa PF-1]EPQ26974.1 hypothetical protein PFL1_05609 [Pseudozyma flocculosa PF-1]
MKFGKTYMETMADPSFPKEWRQGAIEYKHLKKLINGVVAELESLGLGADVLRELLVPHVEALNERTSDDSGPDSKRAPRSSARRDASRSVSPRRDSSAEGRATGGSRRESQQSSLADCDTPGNDSLSPVSEELDPLETEPQQQTPAERWLSNFSAEKIRRPSLTGAATKASADSAAARLRREELGSMERSNSYDADIDGDASSSTSGALPSRVAGPSRLSVPAPSHPKARRSSHAAGERAAVRLARLSLSEAHDGANSGDDDFEEEAGPLEGAKWSGLGRKDLSAMRARRHSTADGPDSVSRPRRSEPSPGRHDWGAQKWRNAPRPTWDSDAERKAAAAAPGPLRWVEGKAGRRARAEYELGGTPEHPVPRIRLFIESPLSSDVEELPEAEARAEAEAEDEDESAEGDLGSRIVELPPSPRLRSSSIPENGPEGESAEEKQVRQSAIRKRRGVRSREIVIPLTADTEFLDTLTGALQNLSNIQGAQHETFVAETESLCTAVARASSPYATKNDLYVWREIFSLWVDFQIFESQREKDRGELSVDESEARLKRFTGELAKRGWMATPGESVANAAGGAGKVKGRLIKRKLGSGPSSQGLSSAASAQAIEDFLKLNFALLDVKKFQRVNVEAARKILKKHDKRTALTASNDLRTFMAQREAMQRRLGGAAGGGGSGMGIVELPASALLPTMTDAASSMGALTSTAAHPSLAALLPSSTTGLLSESLPHILLSLLSTTLLPILPSVDDYSCAICTSVAWRPVRLDCSHLFCIRCLVKLQKQGKSDCPLCRCPGAVANADGRNMDEAAVNFLRTWFPKEVEEKNSENESERHREEMEEMGLRESDKCVIC